MFLLVAAVSYAVINLFGEEGVELVVKRFSARKKLLRQPPCFYLLTPIGLNLNIFH